MTCLSKQLKNQKRDGKPGLAQWTKWKDPCWDWAGYGPVYLKAGKAWKCLSPGREQPYLPLVKKKELPLLSRIQNTENVRNNSVIALRWVLIRLDRLKILPLSWRTVPSRTRSTQYDMVMTYRLAIESTRLHDVRKLTKQESRENPQKQENLRLILPWARYVRRLCFCAWFTWIWEINRVSTSRPFTWKMIAICILEE